MTIMSCVNNNGEECIHETMRTTWDDKNAKAKATAIATNLRTSPRVDPVYATVLDIPFWNNSNLEPLVAITPRL
jgi:hypothetical protein